MDIEYTVNRASTSEVAAEVEHMGNMVEAKVPQLEVELVDPTGQHGSLVLRFRSMGDRKLAAQFKQGSKVTVSIAAAAAGEAVETA